MGEPAWHAAFPVPTSSPSSITSAELRELLIGQPDLFARTFVVVDARRTDFEDGFIKGAINLPAHSFYQTLPSLLPVLSRYERVIFHCNSCKAGSRGAKTAGWYQDALDEAGITKSKAVVLEGGIKGWLGAYAEDKAVTVAL